jgi:hypothetical protein
VTSTTPAAGPPSTETRDLLPRRRHRDRRPGLHSAGRPIIFVPEIPRGVSRREWIR